MKETLYSRRSNLVVGFHGCDQSIANKIIEGKDDLIASTNDMIGWDMESIFGKTTSFVHCNMQMI